MRELKPFQISRIVDKTNAIAASRDRSGNPTGLLVKITCELSVTARDRVGYFDYKEQTEAVCNSKGRIARPGGCATFRIAACN